MATNALCIQTTILAALLFGLISVALGVTADLWANAPGSVHCRASDLYDSHTMALLVMLGV